MQHEVAVFSFSITIEKKASSVIKLYDIISCMNSYRSVHEPPFKYAWEVSMASTDDYIGSQLGNYLIGARLASGQFGSVYYGKHQILDRQVAIKFLHNIHLSSLEERKAFFQEAKFLEQLEHPHCLRVYDVGIDSNVPYIISQYAANGSLWDRLQKRRKFFPLDYVLSILSQIGQALQHAHDQNIIHRDLKPANILFAQNDQVLLADFGLAVVLHAASVQKVDIAGTPEYMAPEQFHGQAGRKSDQYALGCIAYELVTGHLPFETADFVSLGYVHSMQKPAPPSHSNPSLPPHIERAILKAMGKQRADRFASIQDFITALTTPTPLIQEKRSQPVIQAPQSPSPSLNQLIEQGHTYMQQKRYKEAIHAYEEALRRDVQNITATLGKAQALTKLTMYEQALIVYELVLSFDPRSLPGYLGKGYVLHQLKRYQDALLTYKEAQHLYPQEREVYLGKYTLYLELKRYEPALVAINQAIQIDPHHALAYNDKARLLVELQRYEEAIDACEQAIQQNPGLVEAHYRKGFALCQLRRPTEAIAVANTILQVDSQCASAYVLRGYIFLELGQPKEALVECNQALLLQHDLRAAYACKADALEGLGRGAEARRARQKAQE